MISKFRLYEAAVQNPRWQVDYLPQFHRWLTGKEPRSMREDFCGSAAISCEWVKKSNKNQALGLDIDPEPLDYAKNVNRAALPEEAQKRLKILKQNVLKTTREKFDTIWAFNFSFFDFHERKDMLVYAKSVRQSLKKKGTFFLEVAGGEGFTETLQEKQMLQVPGVGSVRKIWEQHQYDSITQVCDYSLHFQLPEGKWLSDAFTYHWRIWGIRDLREVLQDAGFKKTVVLWESQDEKGRGQGEYLPTEEADSARSWVAYVVGVK